jgi:feruloyl esterase
MVSLITLVTFLSALVGADQIFSDPVAECQNFASSLSLPNTTINFVEYVSAGTNLTFSQDDGLDACGFPNQVVPVDLCRVAMYVATSNQSGRSNP